MTHEGDEVAGPVPPSRLFLVGLSLLLLFVSFVIIRPYLGAVVLAVLIGFLMQPVNDRILARVKRPSVAATISTLLVALALVVPLAFIVGQLRDEAQMVVAYAQDPAGLQAALDDLGARFGMDQAQVDALLQRALESAGGFLSGAAGGALSAAFEVFAGLIVFFFLLWFTLRDGRAFIAAAKRLTPIRTGQRDRLYGLIGQRTKAIALGTFLVSVAQGVAAGLGWWFFGFPAPVFWGFVMTVIAVLPLGAPFLVLVPAGIVALLQGDYFAGIGILVYGAVVVGSIDNILRPFVVGRGGDAHPAIIIVGTIGGLAVFGVSGFLLGPLLLSLLGPVLEVWAEDRRRDAADRNVL